LHVCVWLVLIPSLPPRGRRMAAAGRPEDGAARPHPIIFVTWTIHCARLFSGCRVVTRGGYEPAKARLPLCVGMFYSKLVSKVFEQRTFWTQWSRSSRAAEVGDFHTTAPALADLTCSGVFLAKGFGIELRTARGARRGWLYGARFARAFDEVQMEADPPRCCRFVRKRGVRIRLPLPCPAALRIYFKQMAEWEVGIQPPSRITPAGVLFLAVCVSSKSGTRRVQSYYWTALSGGAKMPNWCTQRIC
jgi:hypothetical protein